MEVSALNKRRWRNFRANKRAYWSLIIFSICFLLSLFAELIANDKPILVKYRGEYFFPIANFYPETAFAKEFKQPVAAMLAARPGCGKTAISAGLPA